MRFVYPNGLRKALTFSYDDGQIFDRRLAELFRQHGMKATFHLNSATLSRDSSNTTFVGVEELEQVYEGHEVACHGLQHRTPTTLSDQQLVQEILEDRKELEKLTGKFVQGMSYAFGNYDRDVIRIARSLGIKYSRTVKSTNNFFPPEDFMEWHPTCHHSGNLLELGERFLNVSEWMELPLMYVWGHSYEFGLSDDWSVIEQFCEKMEGKKDIWYATNMEIYEYIAAIRNLELSADGMSMYNPSAVSVWVLASGMNIEIPSGETVYIGEH